MHCRKVVQSINLYQLFDWMKAYQEVIYCLLALFLSTVLATMPTRISASEPLKVWSYASQLNDIDAIVLIHRLNVPLTGALFHR